MKETWSEIFKTFMEKQSAWDKYVREYEERKKIKSMNDFFKYTFPIGFLDYVFSWEKSKDGFKFWYDLNQKWIDRIIEINRRSREKGED